MPHRPIYVAPIHKPNSNTNTTIDGDFIGIIFGSTAGVILLFVIIIFFIHKYKKILNDCCKYEKCEKCYKCEKCNKCEKCGNIIPELNNNDKSNNQI